MSIFVFGEGMLELSAIRNGASRVSFGGDALNTAIYLRRANVEVEFVSALGDDPYSQWMRSAWTEEGLRLNHCLEFAGGKPGLYAISVDERGERSFTYWRNESAARRFFDHPGAQRAIDVMKHAPLLYLTGITLSIFETADRARIFETMKAVRTRGGKVAFDVNYRPKGWLKKNDAQSAIRAALQQASIAFSSVEDWTLLFGEVSAEAAAAESKSLGNSEVVVKDGVRGCYFAVGEKCGWVAPAAPRTPVDTTGAGDSFNAAYLAARLRGASPIEACKEGNKLAETVIMQSGAIGPLRNGDLPL